VHQGDTDCIVALITGVSIGDTIGNSPDLNGILYTNGANELVTDPLFLRDPTTQETIIAKDFDIAITQYDLETVNIIGINNLSNEFTIGEQITGGTSNTTATVEYYQNGFLYITNIVGNFIDNEVLTGGTSGETALISEPYPITPFSVDDTFIVYDLDTQSQIGTGIITAVTGNGYTVTPTSGTFDQYDLIVDSLGGGLSKIAGVLDGAPAAPTFASATGGFQIGELIGGYIQGIGMTYNSDDANRFATQFVGSFAGSDNYSAGTLIGNIALNNHSSIIQNLTGLGGSPSIEMGTVDAMNNHNTNVLLNRSRIVLQANQEVSLLGRVQIGGYDYNNDDPDIHYYPAFPDYYYLPQSRGSAGQVLTDDGNGNVTWQTPAGGTSLIGSTSDLGNETWLGTNAGNGGSSNNTVFLGIQAGYQATNADYSNFIGSDAGREATFATGANFLGNTAGYQATNASYSNFLGNQTGREATNASYSNFSGSNAGYGATDAYNSNFFGNSAGNGATGANNSNFFGANSGYQAVNAANSIFIGQEAGTIATNASNSIFLGKQSGVSDTVDNTTSSNDFSILIGPETSTGGFSNSIAIGSQANNTASNQFMIGSTTRTIDTTVWNGSASTTCTLTTGTGIACSSDERLKTNITDLNADTLDKLLNLKTVSYNWIQNPESKTQIGFLAQDLEQYFPELVNTDLKGMKSVYYAQMTPILVEAIRAMNLKITEINIIEKPNTWRDSLIAWFANTANGITEFIAGTLRAKDQLCVGQTCVTESQLQQLLNGQGIQQAPAPTPAPTPEPTPDTTVESESVDTEITRETDTTPPDNNETITEDTDTTTDEPIITPEPETITSSEETPPIDVVTE
jgi:hypothetical protein